jgi:putative redox protein
MGTLKVRYLGGDRFSIDIRSFGLDVDQPLAAGGTDMAPTPTELFVASLAACAGFYAERYLHRHGFSTEHLGVDCSFEMSDRSPHRVARIQLELSIPVTLPPDRREALLKMVDGCTVKNSIFHPPDIQVELKEGKREKGREAA